MTIGFFLTQVFFNLIIFLFGLRLILRYFKISPLHPIRQAIDNFSKPIFKPLEPYLYKNKINSQRYDYLALVLIIIIEFCKFSALSLIAYQQIIPMTYLVLLVMADLIIQLANLFFYMILIRVVMSWVNPHWQHPVADILKRVTDPLFELQPKILGNTAGFNFFPYLLLIILKAITLFITASMPLSLL